MYPELATEGFTLAHLGVTAACFALLWLAFAVRAFLAAKGPLPAKANAEPDELPPAIVDLITRNGRLSASDASAATLLGLAADGHLEIESVGPEMSLIRLRSSVDSGGFSGYQMEVWKRTQELAGADGVVAANALAAQVPSVWQERFAKSVIVHSRALGLTRKIGGTWSFMGLTGLALAALLGMLADLTVIPRLGGDPAGALILPAVLAGIFGMSQLDDLLGGERLTAKGRRAASAWLAARDHLRGIHDIANLPPAAVTIWGRQFAYAAALGLAPRAVAGLPLAEPRGQDTAWSDYGGMWHLVRIHGTGAKALGRLFGAALIVVWGGGSVAFTLWYAVTDQVPAELPKAWAFAYAALGIGAAIVVLLLVIALPARAILSRYRAGEMGPQTTVKGQVLRLYGTPGHRVIVLDVGRRTAAVLEMAPHLPSLREGDIVHAEVSRRKLLVGFSIVT